MWGACLIALCVGLALTTATWLNAKRQQSAHLGKEFSFVSEQMANNIASRVYAYQSVMRGVQGYFQGSNEVTFSEFQKYVADLHLDKKHSGIQGVGLAELVTSENRAAHLAFVRHHHVGDYTIRPAGQRDVYTPIVRMEPMNADNRKVIGFDIFTLPHVRAAMERARDLDDIAITPPITLVQDAGKQDVHAFVMYLPVYAKAMPVRTVAERRAAVRAWVDVPFRIADLMDGLRGELPTDVSIAIYDGERVDRQARMYASAMASSAASASALQHVRQLKVGGRTWTLVTTGSPAFEARMSNTLQPGLIALTGCLLSLILVWTTWLLVSGRQRAEVRYKQLFSQAGEGVLILNAAHRILECNASAARMFGYRRDELLHRHLSDLMVDAQALQAWPVHARGLWEWQHKRKDGSEFTAEVSDSQLDDQHHFVILRDLTERKKAEQRIQRLNHLYLALSETNQAIVRMDNESDLFPLVCRCAVELGELKMAWIGLINPSGQSVRPVAMHAVHAGDLGLLRTEGRGVTFRFGADLAQAMAANTPVIVNDIAEEGAEGMWRMPLRAQGWQSVASFPIRRNGRLYAMLTVHHDAKHAFDQEAIGLLAEMTGDISFALDNFERESQRLRSEKLLIESEHKLSLILNNVSACIYLKDVHGKYLFANQRVLDLWGVSLEEVIGAGDERFFDAETTRQIQASDYRVLVDGETIEVEEANVLEKNGELRVYWSTKIPLRRKNGSIYGLCGISTDITQHQRAEADLRIAAISFESKIGMMITDKHKVVLKVNQTYSKITGYTAEEVVGTVPALMSAEHHDAHFCNRVWREVDEHGVWEGEVWSRRKNNEAYSQHLVITAVRDPRQEITNYVASLNDITESKAAALEIEHLAYYDALTKLPNRRLFLDRLGRALVASQRSGLFGALLYLDLDHFKNINDSKGHDVGDLLLKEVSKRLLTCVRAEDTVARLGGDEYVIMLEGVGHDEVLAATQTDFITHKIQHALRQPYLIGNDQFNISASIGQVLFQGQEKAEDELLKQADIAMYHAKKAGRDTFRFFDPHMQHLIDTRVLLEEELRDAQLLNQLVLYYQPQVDVDGVVLGAEALIRWQHPERGMIPPLHFIPLAEESGLILPIGQWVLQQACAQLKQWEADAATRHLSISINVSARQFHQADFVNQVRAAVERFQIQPMLLKLELTESMLVDNIESIISSMHLLKEVGVRFELDDFGTGYSSLQYLKRLPLHQLKIDRSFVRDINHDKTDKAIVETIVKMAQGLGLEVIAEGVETSEQLLQLRKLGCLYYQGYLFSEPVPAAQFVSVLDKLHRVAVAGTRSTSA